MDLVQNTYIGNSIHLHSNAGMTHINCPQIESRLMHLACDSLKQVLMFRTVVG